MGKWGKVDWQEDLQEQLSRITDPEQRQMVIKFYKEFHKADFYNDEEDIIKDPEMRKEAVRNHNMNNRDAFNVAHKQGMLSSMTSKDEFMEAASDDWDWQGEYKENGYEAAVNCILEQTVRDLQNKKLDIKVTLIRFHSKMNELYRTDKRTNKRRKRYGED